MQSTTAEKEFLCWTLEGLCEVYQVHKGLGFFKAEKLMVVFLSYSFQLHGVNNPCLKHRRYCSISQESWEKYKIWIQALISRFTVLKQNIKFYISNINIKRPFIPIWSRLPEDRGDSYRNADYQSTNYVKINTCKTEGLHFLSLFSLIISFSIITKPFHNMHHNLNSSKATAASC